MRRIKKKKRQEIYIATRKYPKTLTDWYIINFNKRNKFGTNELYIYKFRDNLYIFLIKCSWILIYPI